MLLKLALLMLMLWNGPGDRVSSESRRPLLMPTEQPVMQSNLPPPPPK